jgi:hypothetical protein
VRSLLKDGYGASEHNANREREGCDTLCASLVGAGGGERGGGGGGGGVGGRDCGSVSAV